MSSKSHTLKNKSDVQKENNRLGEILFIIKDVAERKKHTHL